MMEPIIVILLILLAMLLAFILMCLSDLHTKITAYMKVRADSSLEFENQAVVFHKEEGKAFRLTEALRMMNDARWEAQTMTKTDEGDLIILFSRERKS